VKSLRLLLVLLLATSVSPAFGGEPVHVVKFINFSCSVCRASEVLDAPIKAEVEKHGGRFIVAPLPRGMDEARERFYYALRELGPEVEAQTRLSLFRGAQDLNYPLSDVPQVLDWLQSDLRVPSIDWTQILTEVNGTAPAAAVERAVVLAIRSGVQVVPAYVLVQGDRILATLDPKSTPGGQLPALREAVIDAVRNSNSAS